MPRRTRMYEPGVPVHVVQRGHNRQACFFSEFDYQFYKESLIEALERYGGEVHAYCLMTNHIHLLITPAEEDTIQRVMQHLGRRYVQYVNKTYNRSGSLWEGRHKGSMITSDDYLLKCYRYIELNPVSACMVDKPEEYAWSSYHVNALGGNDGIVVPHALYSQLAADVDERLFCYRELFCVALCDFDVHEISEAVERNLDL